MKDDDPMETDSGMLNLGRGLLLASMGGAWGGVLRWAITANLEATLLITMAINVIGAVALAALPHLRVVQRRQWLPTLLGSGFLGGFTTMSGAALLNPSHRMLSLTIFGLTAVLALVLTRFVGRWVAPTQAISFEEAGGIE
ncbi:MAG TPA: CrcB family protein [Marmoricola sp.]|nr:CrcB family protein [Marmoricola sp.]HNN48706.1 CrcB family protein [Marmoricola sp.]